MQTAKNISYGDSKSHLVLWQKALLLVPIWAIPLVPIVGFICRGMGNLAMQLGYGVMLCLFISYFLEDLLKRKIRLDDEHIFFGFKAIPIKEIVSVDVIYKKAKFLPDALTITSLSGSGLKLSMNGLAKEGVDTLLKHLQSRNSTLKTVAVLSTLVKCRQVKRQSLDRADKLELPFHSRQLIDESIDTFRSTARKWMRVGPLLFCLLMGPVWMTWLSTLYVCLQPNCLSQVEALHLHQFLMNCSEGLRQLIFTAAAHASDSVHQHFAQNHLVTFLTATSILSFFVCLQRLFWQPNLLIADKLGMKLIIRLGEISFPIAKVDWSQIARVDLNKASGGIGKIRITKTDGKIFDIDLSAIMPEDRSLLLARMEKLVPDCQINHELSQSMLPKSDHSYTEIWLQSLNQLPERKTLEPLEPGQIVGENRFEVLKSLGVGGQGIAYLCRTLDANKEETVVLKETIIPVFVDDAVRRKAFERFEQEASLLKSLSNDNIVKLLDCFVEDHRAYLVLEHIDGCTLRELVLRDGPLANEQVHDIALQMCDILKFLHSHAVVHRDFTPDNLIFNAKGKLKLIDFNVAQQIQGGTTGTVVGKHAYLPPEQFRGKATTQSDLYAFGASMYFMLTGTDPEPISQSSPAARNAEVGDAFDRIVKRATALQVSNRYQSADDIESELLSIEEKGQILSTTLGSKEKVLKHG